MAVLAGRASTMLLHALLKDRVRTPDAARKAFCAATLPPPRPPIHGHHDLRAPLGPAVMQFDRKMLLERVPGDPERHRNRSHPHAAGDQHLDLLPLVICWTESWPTALGFGGWRFRLHAVFPHPVIY